MFLEVSLDSEETFGRDARVFAPASRESTSAPAPGGVPDAVAGHVAGHDDQVYEEEIDVAERSEESGEDRDDRAFHHRQREEDGVGVCGEEREEVG